MPSIASIAFHLPSPDILWRVWSGFGIAAFGLALALAGIHARRLWNRSKFLRLYPRGWGTWVMVLHGVVAMILGVTLMAGLI